RRLTRAELSRALAAEGIQAQGSRLGHVLLHAELRAIVCSGGLRGRQHTYALVDEIVPATKPRTPAEALAELTLRYFRGHGPATVRDFAWWSSLPAKDIRRGLEMVSDRLEHAVVDGRTYWFEPPLQPRRQPSPTAHLLQCWDEYVIGYSESRQLADMAGRLPGLGEDRQFIHWVLLDGQIVGRWRRRPGSAAEVQVSWLVDLDPAQCAAVDDAIARYREFDRQARAS
ncbi:MAG: winged helix DNA-binding domain-containing protein, partial [Chloroflexota bacterium]|nr:winged helix DNA-binding domain-containing protein [Chloroflexota bacterium]